MEKKQWVQHISGQGEKWEIQKYQDPEWPSWVAPHTVAGGGLLYLPKSEYHLCDPPEVWRDVTEECEVVGAENKCTVKASGGIVTTNKGYRLRKIEVNRIGPGVPYGCSKQWAFIVEQKVTQ